MAARIGIDLTGKVAVITGASSGIGAASARLFAPIRAFAPLLRESGDGVIVNISSGAAQSGTGSSMIYAASKAALNTMSLSLARVLGPEIRVIVVAPGMVHTGFVPGRTEEMMAKAAIATPLKRAIEPEDVALAVISCVTHLTHTTGSIIAVDAGRHLRGVDGEYPP